METWPLPMRRAAALAILLALLTAVAVYVLLPLFAFVGGKIDTLNESRFELARLEARAARPALPKVTPVPKGEYIAAPNSGAAVAQLQAILASAATQNLVEVTAIAAQPLTGPEALVGVRLTVIGDEQSLRAFVRAMEGGQPYTRFRSWSWRAAEGKASLRFEATAVASWQSK